MQVYQTNNERRQDKATVYNKLTTYRGTALVTVAGAAGMSLFESLSNLCK